MKITPPCPHDGAGKLHPAWEQSVTTLADEILGDTSWCRRNGNASIENSLHRIEANWNEDNRSARTYWAIGIGVAATVACTQRLYYLKMSANTRPKPAIA